MTKDHGKILIKQQIVRSFEEPMIVDIDEVQEWLGHANIATTRIYDHHKTRPEDSPTFKVNY